jgi:Hint domain
VAPVHIQRSAFADNIPHADLLLSPDHAIFVDGRLICARQLINGTTIRQERGGISVEYFHIQLDAHGILLAEGLPAESYLNAGNHGFFANSDEPLVLHPALTDETDYPTREAASCAPFVWDEGNVRPVWQRLAERAEALGQLAPKPDTTANPELRIVTKGREVHPVYSDNGLFIFALPKGAAEARLISRFGSPTNTRPWLEDRRCLGVYVERITLRSLSEVHEVPLDHPDLSQGWWAVERDGIAMRRWTDGNAALPLPVVDSPRMLEIRASNAELLYLTGADQGHHAA